MANFITPATDINANNLITVSSRYRNSQAIYYTELNRLTFTTYKRKPFVPTSKDKFMLITKGLEYRPDKVSFKAYGIPDLWWRIMEANQIYDIFDFKAGTNIRIPNVII